MEENVNQFVQSLKHHLEICLTELHPGKDLPTSPLKFIISLSGGSDSTALLVGLTQLASETNWQVIASHINHNLRGAESKADEEFCRSLCNTLKIKLDLHQDKTFVESEAGEVQVFADANISEESLRKRRYNFLLDSAKKHQARHVLTAHTLDDQVETVLFRLMRGSSLKGLSGISLSSRLEEGVQLLRPLLSLSKQQCSQFLLEQSFGFRGDSSNLNQNYTRNFLRHAVIPLVETRFNNFSAHVEQLREIICTEDAWLSQLTKQHISQMEKASNLYGAWSIDMFNFHPRALKRRIVAQALRHRGLEPSFKRIEELIEKTAIYMNGRLSNGAPSIPALTLSSRWRIFFSNDLLIWQDNQEPETMINPDFQTNIEESLLSYFRPITVRIPGNNMVLSHSRVLRIEDLSAQSAGNERFNFPKATSAEALVDLSRVIYPLILRLRAAGDIIQPLGMKEKVRLKQYLHTHKRYSRGDKVDRNSLAEQLSVAKNFGKNESKDSVVVLADQEEVLWVPGIGLSEKIKVITSPTHRLKWLPIASDSSDIA